MENNNGIKVYELGFILIDFNKEDHKDNTFIMASQAKQAFYITDPADRKWSIVLLMKPKNIPNCEARNDTGDNIDKIPSFYLEITRGDNVDGDDYNDNVEDNELYVRAYHFKGILVEKNSKNKKI